MSKNNQYLIKKHKNKYYIFDVMAESWGEWEQKPDGNIKEISDKNKLSLGSAIASARTYKNAHRKAHQLDQEDWSEYGVVDEVLAKDGAEVIIEE